MSPFNEMVERYTVKGDRTMKRICAPLANSLSIDVFVYFRIESDGKFGHLSNYPENLDFFYSERLYLDYPYFIHPCLLRDGAVLTTVANKASDAETIIQRFQMSHLFIIFQKNGDSIEGYGFATKMTDEKKIGDFYPKLNLLYTFIAYFKREAKLLVKNMMTDSYNLAAAKGSAFFEADPALPLLNVDPQAKNFLKAVCPLSYREQQCLDLFKQGKSAQASAVELNLSQRTVEHYLENVKEKLGCSSKWELLKW